MNNKQRINVTQSQMPNREKLHVFVDQILDSGWLTNRGQCVRELEEKLQGYLGVRNVVLANDATSGLQVAYKALDFKGEVITLPFTLYPLHLLQRQALLFATAAYVNLEQRS